MRKISIIIILLFLQCSAYAQRNHSADSIKYLIAYNIIINDTVNKGKTLMVSDSIVELFVGFFYKELKQKDENEVAVRVRLHKIKQDIDPCFKLTFLGDRNRKYSNNIVHFSPIINDSILRADLFKHEKSLNKYEHLNAEIFCEGCIYLFLFDKNGKLKSYFRNEMIWE